MNMPFLTMQALLGTDKRPPELPADDSEPGRLMQAIAAARDGSENAEALKLAPRRRGAGRLRAGGVPAAPRRLRPPRALPAGTPRVRRQGRRHRRIAPSPFQRIRPYAP